MKVLNKIKNIFIGVLVVVFSLFALVMTLLLLNYNKYGVTEFGSKSLVLIKEEITNKNYQKGDLVIVEKTRYDVINKGDEIFAYSVTSTGKANVEVGIVGEKYDNQKAIAYENGASFSEEYVIGKADKVYHNLGSYLSIVESKWGFLFIVLVPGFTIFLYELYALIVEIKYGDEEEEKAQ